MVACHQRAGSFTVPIIIACMELRAHCCTVVLPIPASAREDDAPGCTGCAVPMALLAKLPAFGRRPLVKVFRCDGCRTISHTEH
jgi:hypothetical protein